MTVAFNFFHIDFITRVELLHHFPNLIPGAVSAWLQIKGMNIVIVTMIRTRSPHWLHWIRKGNLLFEQ